MPQMIYSRNNIFCANEMFRVTIFFAQTKYFATQYFLRNIPRHNIVMPRTISFITTPKRRYFFIISFMRYYITKQTRYYARKYCSSNSTHEVSRKTECYSSKNNISLEQNDRINIDFINKLANNARIFRLWHCIQTLLCYRISLCYDKAIYRKFIITKCTFSINLTFSFFFI